MIYANYDEYEKTNRKAYDKFNKGKIFYAFNLEQLKEGMESIGLNLKETKKLLTQVPEYIYVLMKYKITKNLKTNNVKNLKKI